MSFRLLPKLLLPACVISLMACNEYYTPPSTSLPMTQGPSGAPQDNPHARPTVRFPARVAVARIEKSGDSFHLVSGANEEDPAHAAKAASLPGVRAFVPLNRVALTGSVKSYRELDREALKMGADILAVYRYDTDVAVNDAFEPLTLATLGFAPTIKHETSSVVTLIVRDARTGYVYGVLEERADRGGVTTGMTLYGSERNAKKFTRKQAMDRLMERLPGFWNGILAKGR
ncbi:hypothetical protein [Luteolibacter luteus]|uniref:Lipoprotein n=1 Tax=Luteolibacter luteus TaxID=2728835 RepID=A0A858RQN1_9BACT|nr:hypothetical protein [Luteolibacter luteus]QJE98659.1 hypothetical protein HHL09_23695 [Luteolibacter luteus]